MDGGNVVNNEEKKQLVTRIVRALLRGDAEAAAPHLTEDVTWWWAKSLTANLPHPTTKAQILEQTAHIPQMFPGGIKTEIHNLFCDGDTVLVEFNNQATTANGKFYDNDYIVAFVLQDDKVKAIREYQDSLTVFRV